ncbi:hypothetical protein SLA2020_220230 [Shorea laevis]
MVKTQFAKIIKVLKTNNAIEYLSTKLQSFLKQYERFWGEIALTAVYLINRIPSSIFNNQPSYEHLHGTFDELYNALPRALTSSVGDDLLVDNVLDNFEPSFASSSVSHIDVASDVVESTNELVIPSSSHPTWIKMQSDGFMERYKTCLVAKGFTQEYGIDYKEIFALVARLTSVRNLIAIAAIWRWKLFHMDVKNAFLNSDLKEKVHMKPTHGLNHPPNKWLLKDMGIPQLSSTDLYCDNQSNIQITHNDIFNEHTKHIKVDYHFICHHVAKGTICLIFINFADQPVDLFTKSHFSRHFQTFLSKIKLVSSLPP